MSVVEIIDSNWQPVTTLLLFVWDTVDFLAATLSFHYVKSKFFWAYYVIRSLLTLIVSYGVSFFGVLSLPQGPGSGIGKAIVVSVLAVIVLQNFVLRTGNVNVDFQEQFSLMRTTAINDVKRLSGAKHLGEMTRSANDLTTRFALDQLKREKRSWLDLNYEPATAKAKFDEYEKFYAELPVDDQKRGFAVAIVKEAGIDYAKRLLHPPSP